MSGFHRIPLGGNSQTASFHGTTKGRPVLSVAMRLTVQRLVPPAGPRWLLAGLAPALILGIIAMHSLLAQAPTSEHTGMAAVSPATSTSSEHGATHPESSMTAAAIAPDDGGHGQEGPMPDCGGLMVMCMAMLVAAAAYVALRRGALHRVLWKRPLPIKVRFGTVRAAFEQLTPLQRTAVIRC